MLFLFSRVEEIKVDKVSFDLRVRLLYFHTKFTMTILIGNACLFSEENLARILGFKGVCNAQNLWTIFIKPVHPIPIYNQVLFWLYIHVYYMQVLSVP